MTEQPLELRASLRTISRRRRLVGVVAAIGLLGGLVYGVINPPMPSAVALVLLPPTTLTASGTPTRDVTTQIVIATSAPVLSAAGTSVSPPIGSAKLKGQVGVTAPSQDILKIAASDSHPKDAVRLANAVANDYIQFVATSGATATASALAGVRHESTQLTQQIQNLQSQINTVSARVTAEGASSPAGQQDSTLLGSLSNAQREASLDLINVNNQVVTTQLSGAAAGQGTRILQRATAAVPSSLLAILTTGVVGLLLGLVVGIPIALWRSRRDRRLRRRDEIAIAISVPVLGSFEAERHDSTADWATLLDNYHPSTVDEWNLDRVLRRLEPGNATGGRQIRVVSFADDRAALASGPQMAIFAAEQGVPIDLVPSDHEAFVALRAALHAMQKPDVPGQPIDSTPPSYGMDQVGGHLTLSTEAVDRTRPELDAFPGVTLLAVSAGFATADDLARLALVAADAGISIDGILVVNPDANDTTTGALADPGVGGRPTYGGMSKDTFAEGHRHSEMAANDNGSNGHGAAVSERDESHGWTGTFISLHVLTSAARRHWRLLLAVALAGSVIGAGLHLVVPRKFSSTTDVFLTEPAGSDPTLAMANDTGLLQTRAVAQRAIATLHLRASPTTFLASYQGIALSNAILEITFSAHSPAAAVAEGNAVARAFLHVRTSELDLQTQVVVKGLQAQVNALDSESQKLSSSIDVLSASPVGSQSDTELADLVEQRSEDTSQVAQVESQIQQEHLDATSVTQASDVLDPAALVKVSAKKVTLTDALSGLIGALGLALIILVTGVLLSDRLRSRQEVAATLGTQVELSIFRCAPRRMMRKRRRHKLLTAPTEALHMIERRLRSNLESSGGPALVVVEMETSDSSALAVGVLALSLAAEQKRVVMVDVANGRPLASLFGVTSRERQVHTVTAGNQTAFLIVGPDDPAEMGIDWTPDGADALVVLASVAPAFGAEHLAVWATKAVVIVDPTKVTAASIRVTGELLRRAMMSIRSAIVIGADPDEDDTLGASGPAPRHDVQEIRTNGVLQASGW